MVSFSRHTLWGLKNYSSLNLIYKFSNFRISQYLIGWNRASEPGIGLQVRGILFIICGENLSVVQPAYSEAETKWRGEEDLEPAADPTHWTEVTLGVLPPLQGLLWEACPEG